MLGDQVLAGGLGRFEPRAAGDSPGALRINKVRATRHFATKTTAVQHVEEFPQAALILGAHAAGNLRFVQRRGGRFLNGQKLPRIAVVLHVGKSLHDPPMAANPAQPPADHVKSLGHRVHFDADVFGPGHGQKAQRLALVREHHVRGVLHDHDVVLVREIDGPLVKVARGHLARRAVGIAQHQQLGLPAHVGGNRIQLGQEIIFPRQRQGIHAAAVILRVRAGNRITRHGHERHVARIDERRRQHRQRRFRADAMVDFAVRIELDAKIALHEPRHGFLEFGRAVVGIAPVFRPVDFLGHPRANALGRHLVVLADAEIDQRSLGMLGHRFALGSFDLLELVDLRAFAVIRAADALGKQSLKVRIAHGNSIARKVVAGPKAVA